MKEGGTSVESRLSLAFKLATGHAPNDHELHILEDALAKMRAAFEKDDAGAHDLLRVGAAKSDASIPAAELAAWTAVANIILNMDETITKG